MLLQDLNSAMALADFMRGIFAVQDCEERICFLDCGRMLRPKEVQVVKRFGLAA